MHPSFILLTYRFSSKLSFSAETFFLHSDIELKFGRSGPCGLQQKTRILGCPKTPCSTSYTPRVGSETRGYGFNFLFVIAQVSLHKIGSGEKSYSQGAGWGRVKSGTIKFIFRSCLRKNFNCGQYMVDNMNFCL